MHRPVRTVWCPGIIRTNHWNALKFCGKLPSINTKATTVYFLSYCVDFPRNARCKLKTKLRIQRFGILKIGHVSFVLIRKQFDLEYLLKAVYMRLKTAVRLSFYWGPISYRLEMTVELLKIKFQHKQIVDFAHECSEIRQK